MRTKGLFLTILAFGLMLAGCMGRQLTTSPKAESNGDNIGQSAGTTATQSSVGSTTQQVNATAPNKPGHVNIKGLDINIDQIPIRGRLVVANDVKNIETQKTSDGKSAKIEYSTTISAYSSTNRKYIALATTKTPIKNIEHGYTIENIGETKIEMFESNTGKLQWQAINNMNIEQGIVSNNGYLHVIWSNGNTEEYKYSSFDKSGNTVKTMDSVKFTYSGGNANSVFYTKENAKSSTIYFENIETKNSWQLPFSQYASIVAISLDENAVIVRTESDIISINENGKTIWQKKYGGTKGEYSLSDNGKYLAWFPKVGEVIIINNGNGEELFKTNKVVDNEPTFDVLYGKFIGNKELILLCDYKKGLIINFKGEILNSININFSINSLFYITEKDNNTFSILSGGKEFFYSLTNK